MGLSLKIFLLFGLIIFLTFVSTAVVTLSIASIYAVIFVGIFFLIAGFAAAFFIGISITKPIKNAADSLEAIALGEGDLTCVITASAGNELGRMAKCFNLAVERIKRLVISVKSEARDLSDIGINLATNMNETAAAVEEINNSVFNIRGKIINQSSSVSETHATMEQVVDNINKLNVHVERQTESVAESSSAIEEMLANIQSVTQTLVRNQENVNMLKESSVAGRQGLQEVASDIQEIVRESKGLLEIIAVMESIAGQTNLLSMNAAIQAARAGEAGKGFAVVAAEIRKLADNSSRQSQTINNVLKKIKESIDKITVSTDNVLERFETIDHGVKVVAEQEENIRNAMEEQGQGSKQILAAINHLNEITRQVRGGSNKMLEGSQEVIKESKNLKHTTLEITASMEEMAMGAGHINSAVNSVNEITRSNREKINVLIKDASCFKVE